MINAENSQLEQRRLAWRCRRGMLELDIVLQRFVAGHFNTLNLVELQAFDAMLDLPDNQFWAMLSSATYQDFDPIRNTVIAKLKAAK